MRNDISKEHTFVVCAYKESKYLGQCVKSLINQAVKSRIIMVTSTPNEHISGVAKQYGIPLYINEGEKGIGADWNFGVSKASTKYVTVAHQDDIYEPNYSLQCIKAAEKSRRPIIIFTNYGELRDGRKVNDNTILKVKRLLLFPLKLSIGGKRIFASSRFIRRRILSLGNAICCPTVTFNREEAVGNIFKNSMKTNLDWEAWELLSRQRGSFVYCDRILMYHRIHEESTTSKLIADNSRTKEDYQMFCRFWPKWIAGLIMKWYSKSQESNTL